MAEYPKTKPIVGRDAAPTIPTKDRFAITRTVGLKRELPGTVILVHGVNDVGTGYHAVEEGVCAGLNERLSRTDIASNGYRLPPQEADAKPVADPDAVYFRRQRTPGAHSPVIPFYWGFREDREEVKRGAVLYHGQNLDRYGNRLDRDGSKGGGPFNNATSALPDMWGPGAGDLGGTLNALNGDPLRPVHDSPPRNYFVLAAERLAMLVRMIRRYDVNESVSIVAHSQGCLITLVAQALLAESKTAEGRPADTLVLTHPPYSLVEQFIERALHWGNIQTARARLKTLVEIVRAVSEQTAAHAARARPFADLAKTPGGIVGPHWKPGEARTWIAGQPGKVFAERDNRGRVFLYFCPEDMTVGLDNVQGIGWQGVPDSIMDQHGLGHAIATSPTRSITPATPDRFRLPALSALASLGFYQRVFTMKERTPKPGAAAERFATGAAPCDFVLRVGSESTKDHVAKEGRTLRSTLPRETRRINAPALPEPYLPDLLAGTTAGKTGPMEKVDPIDAAIATTNGGIGRKSEVIDDPVPGRDLRWGAPQPSPIEPGAWVVPLRTDAIAQLREALYGGRPPAEQPRFIYRVFAKVDKPTRPKATGQLYIERDETSVEAQKRWLGETAPISFHGAIFGNAENHRRVTAYDLAIGQGRAVSDPEFYAYLCEVADWRMKDARPEKLDSNNVRTFDQFRETFERYWSVESSENKALISRTVAYFTEGAPVDRDGKRKLHVAGMPPLIVDESRNSAFSNDARRDASVTTSAPRRKS